MNTKSASDTASRQSFIDAMIESDFDLFSATENCRREASSGQVDVRVCALFRLAISWDSYEMHN